VIYYKRDIQSRKYLTVSESTVYVGMRQYGLSKFEFTDLSDKGLEAEVKQVIADVF